MFHKEGYKIITGSSVLFVSLLLLVNIVMKNISSYNFNLFEVNNNYVQFIATDYDDYNEQDDE